MNTRRDFLKKTLSWGAFGGGYLSLLGRQAMAADPNNEKKMIFIFQRGGNDALNTVIPRGDSAYNTTNRPSIYIQPTNAHALDSTGFAQLHPMMAPMMEIYDGSTSPETNADRPPSLAVIHRVGYAQQSRSHFNSQDYWERGAPRNGAIDNGMFYRQVAEMVDLNDPNNGFAAVSVDSDLMISLKGEVPFPNFTNANQFGFLGDLDEKAHFLGTLPGDPGGPSGVLGMYGGTVLGGAVHAELNHGTGKALGTTLQTLANAPVNSYAPVASAVYPGGSFGSKLMQTAMLLKHTPVRIVGLDIGGWDTHTNQGGEYGNHANRLTDVAEAFQALYRDLEDQWDNLVICAMTEFGRTSKQNGSNGTDHAEGSVMFVAGGGVNGGIYNCHDASDANGKGSPWETGDSGAMFEVNNRYLSHRTDYRSVFGEIFGSHFCDTPQQLDNVIPDFSNLAAGNSTGTFAPLGLFS